MIRVHAINRNFWNQSWKQSSWICMLLVLWACQPSAPDKDLMSHSAGVDTVEDSTRTDATENDDSNGGSDNGGEELRTASTHITLVHGPTDQESKR